MSAQDESRLESLQRSVDRAYMQRNTLAVAAVKMALLLGWPAGQGLDDNEDGEHEWRHVVYIQLPDGSQVSYHIAPGDLGLLDGIPWFSGEWDGSYLGTTKEWIASIPELYTSLVPAGMTLEGWAEDQLEGFALKRWRVELRKVDADDSISPETKDRILCGYIKAWAAG
jgi:hypothetical protein